MARDAERLTQQLQNANNRTFTSNGRTYTSQSGLTALDSQGIAMVADNTDAVLQMLDDGLGTALEVIGLLAEGYAKRLCPVDTGRLRNSITHEISMQKEAYIGTNVEYAEYVEMGTSKRKPKPYLRPAATDHVDEYKAVIKEYVHD